MKGFSLVEIIMGVFITGVMVIVIANIPQAMKLIRGSQSESKVREVVAKKIEDIRLSGYDNLGNNLPDGTPINDPKLNSLANVAGTVLIGDCPAQVCANGELVKNVTITVTWTENANPKRFSVSTLVAKGGLK